MEGKLIPVTNVAADPAIAKVIEPFEVRVSAQMGEIVGEATGDLASSKKVESPLANLVADSFREKGKTQIAIHNTGGIRARITKGPVSWGAVFERTKIECPAAMPSWCSGGTAGSANSRATLP